MPAACFIVLGCPKNIVEGEQMAALCAAAGIAITADLTAADTTIIHTCSFIQDARTESIAAIRRMLARKKAGKLRRVFVTGCLTQDDRKTIAADFPAVDGFAGTGGLDKIAELLTGGQRFICPPAGGLIESPHPRLLSSALPSAYLRIAEGCNHRCGFCAIPRLRGAYRSRRREKIIAEARDLAARGIREIVLVAQDTTSYGRDLYGTYALPELIRSLARITDVRWIRLLYAYPSSVTTALADVFLEEEKLCRYIDMPLQHVSERVLRAMRRPVHALETLRRLKERVPGLAVRSTFIVGYPGETARDFRELRVAVADGWFEHLGVFEYSAVRDTAAAARDHQVPVAVRQERRSELMLLQQKVVAAHHQERLGSSEEVLVEYPVKRGRSVMTACRARFQAPEIDSVIVTKERLQPGSFALLRITGSAGYDLYGESVENHES
jgi:ribosomal protein S12 methylthiotransferase